MDLTIVKYSELDNPNICTIMAISDCDELYRIEKVYRNDRYNDNYHVGKLLDIRGNKLYQNKVPIGNLEKIEKFFKEIKHKFYETTESVTKNMQKRGGGILSIELRNKTNLIPNYYQLHATFETKDSMGANFINSCLEQFAKTLTLMKKPHQRSAMV